VLDHAGNPRGQSLALGVVSLGSPVRQGGSPYGLPLQVPLWDKPVQLPGGIILTGASLDRRLVAAGSPLFVNLRWQSGEDIEKLRSASLVLRQGDPLITETITIGGRYPATRWTVGQPVVNHRRLIVPGAVEDGPADVILQAGGRQVVLGDVEVTASTRRFEPPPIPYEMNVAFEDVATLLGYDLAEGPYYAAQPITVTLYWRALEEAAAADYTVFAHLLDDDGRLVGQHDGRPADGQRPSRSWIPGEVLVDRHPMSFRRPYTGPATIEVGLYRSTDLERVSTDTGGDVVLLPTSLLVAEP
jgi:hypothetical protein